MFRGIIAAICAALLIGCTPASATQNATSTWDTYAATYNFDTTAQLSFPLASFAQAYNGGDFLRDFAGIWDELNEAMRTHLPIGDPDDVLSATLQSWPDPEY